MYNSTSTPFTATTFAAFLTSVGATYSGSSVDNAWLIGFPVVWTQNSIGSEWGVGGNYFNTDLKIYLNNSSLRIVSLKHTLTTDGSTITHNVTKSSVLNAMSFKSDTVIQL